VCSHIGQMTICLSLPITPGLEGSTLNSSEEYHNGAKVSLIVIQIDEVIGSLCSGVSSMTASLPGSITQPEKKKMRDFVL
jgi:hypothetical protein